MKEGKYHYRGWTISISSETKPEDLEYIFKKHPEFKKTVGLEDDISKPKRKSKSDSNDKSK